MHTVETSVAIPIILLILVGMIGVTMALLALVNKQNAGYEQVSVTSDACTRVIRITEVTYATVEDLL